MLSSPRASFSNDEADNLVVPAKDSGEQAQAKRPDGLVPANELPPAADMLARLFPPEEDSSATLQDAGLEKIDLARPDAVAPPGNEKSRSLTKIAVRARNLFRGRKAIEQPNELPGPERLLSVGIFSLAGGSAPPQDSSSAVASEDESGTEIDRTSLPSEKPASDENSNIETPAPKIEALESGAKSAAIPAHESIPSLSDTPPSAESKHADAPLAFETDSEISEGFAIEKLASAAEEENEKDSWDDHKAIVAAIEGYASRADRGLVGASLCAVDPSSSTPPESTPSVSREMHGGYGSEQYDALSSASLHAARDDADPSRSVAADSKPPAANLSRPEENDPKPSSASPGISSAIIPERDWPLEEKLAGHFEWVQSRGTAGKRADLSGAELEGAELIGVNLRYADLHDANLKAADLLMADLRDACLVRTNFRDACLVGTNLEGANLENASLDTAMGLVPRQIAGANLHEASLPPQIEKFEARTEFERTGRMVNGIFTAIMWVCALSWALIWTTRDLQLLTNSSALRFLHSSAAAAALPTGQIYLVAPFALFILYLVFHFQLQHLWDLVLELPAVFPNGRSLDENQPRIVAGLLRNHFRWMIQDDSAARIAEKILAVFLAYWIAPATLLLFWARYLTMQEIHGTVLQEILAVTAFGAALHATVKVGRPAERWMLQENFPARAAAKLREIRPLTAALVFLFILTFLSAGTMAGVPHSKERAPQYMEGSIRRWASSVLWLAGFDPYANLTEAAISSAPPGWSGADDQVSVVKGARLNDSNFRYAQAYRVFLANAHLWHTNFQGAFLPQADLRGADLGQSNLRFAILDQARLNHANLDRSRLDGANLSRADLRDANLSYTSLKGAILTDARLDGATLYSAWLPSATLIRTNFEKADLREANLEGANLEHADLQGAYLWSAKLAGAHLNNAQLGSAIFVDADLRGADLRWSRLSGTVLTGAKLDGASLDGADLRGAEGLGANQVCSAKTRQDAMLDPETQEQVTAQCGAR